jgi:anti-sigma regulatory factor (Ser/Thr protein kinase)
MSEELWGQRPAPDADAPLEVVWEAAPAVLTELTTLRRQLRGQLTARSSEGADAEEAEWLMLAFEELASNGLRHGRPPVQVVVADTGRGWLLDVSDTAADLPPTPAVGRDPATGGLGLYMVARLGAAHGWVVDHSCKHVWVRVDYADAADTPAPRLPRPRDSSEEESRSD